MECYTVLVSATAKNSLSHFYPSAVSCFMCMWCLISLISLTSSLSLNIAIFCNGCCTISLEWKWLEKIAASAVETNYFQHQLGGQIAKGITALSVAIDGTSEHCDTCILPSLSHQRNSPLLSQVTFSPCTVHILFWGKKNVSREL